MEHGITLQLIHKPVRYTTVWYKYRVFRINNDDGLVDSRANDGLVDSRARMMDWLTPGLMMDWLTPGLA